ncbi:MAG: ABC transporter permease [Acidimicrobiales bacterium]
MSVGSVALGIVRRWWVVAFVVVLWEFAVELGHINPIILPGPGPVVGEFISEPSFYLSPLGDTLVTAAVGLVCGVSAGYLMAACAWYLPLLGGLFTPLALVLRSMPFVTLVPVLALVLGYGTTSALVICAVVCFFPTYVLVSTGMRTLPSGADALFAVAGASRATSFRRLVIPTSLPSLATSIRISAATSILAALVAEYLMGTPGLASLLTVALDDLLVTKVWTICLVVAVSAIAVFVATTRLEQTVRERWQ